jgi:hypothetical protein
MIMQELLKEYLHYNPDTGVFTWSKKPSAKVYVGDIAGTLHPRGYIYIKFKGKIHRAHRLAFIYVTGNLPKNEVDHINGVKTDNRWANLRDCTHIENMSNFTKPNKNNKSGLLGVTTKPDGFTAHISKLGTKYYLGFFKTAEEAHNAYRKAKNALNL